MALSRVIKVDGAFKICYRDKVDTIILYYYYLYYNYCFYSRKSIMYMECSVHDAIFLKECTSITL